MRVKDHRERSLLANGCVQTRLPITHGYLVGRSVIIESSPITGHGAGKFPTKPAHDIGIGIVFDRGSKTPQPDACRTVGDTGKIFSKTFAPITIDRKSVV